MKSTQWRTWKKRKAEIRSKKKDDRDEKNEQKKKHRNFTCNAHWIKQSLRSKMFKSCNQIVQNVKSCVHLLLVWYVCELVFFISRAQNIFLFESFLFFIFNFLRYEVTVVLRECVFLLVWKLLLLSIIFGRVNFSLNQWLRVARHSTPSAFFAKMKIIRIYLKNKISRLFLLSPIIVVYCLSQCTVYLSLLLPLLLLLLFTMCYKTSLIFNTHRYQIINFFVIFFFSFLFSLKICTLLSTQIQFLFTAFGSVQNEFQIFPFSH